MRYIWRGNGSQWIGVTGVLWCCMPDFHLIPSEISPYHFNVHHPNILKEDFHDDEAGMRLCQKIISSGVLAANMEVPGDRNYHMEVKLNECSIKFIEFDKYFSYSGVYRIWNMFSLYEIARIRFYWSNNVVRVTEIECGRDKQVLDAFAGDLGLEAQAKILLKHWHIMTPMLVSNILMHVNEVQPPTLVATPHVETEWDVLD